MVVFNVTAVLSMSHYCVHCVLYLFFGFSFVFVPFCAVDYAGYATLFRHTLI